MKKKVEQKKNMSILDNEGTIFSLERVAECMGKGRGERGKKRKI